jgi:hypothetical protein
MKTLGRTLPLLAALLALTALRSSVHAQSTPGVTWACSVDDVGATLTQCKLAPEPGQRLYLTDVVVTSTTAVAGLFLVRTGTGANCGTDTASLLPSAPTVPRVPYPANTAAPTVVKLSTPVMAPLASSICIICSVTNTCTAQMSGYVAP